MSCGDIAHLKSAQVGSTPVLMSDQVSYVGLMELANTTAAIAYVQIFWKAVADVTLGTTVPDVVIALPASGGCVLPFEGEGWRTAGNGPWCLAGTTTRTGNTEALVSVTIWRKR